MLNGEWQDRGFLSGEIQSTIIDTSGEPQEKVVKASVVPVVVKPDANKKLVKVVVEGVTADIDNNILPRNIRGGVEILGVVGDLEPDKPDQTKSIVPTKEQQSVVADAGYELASVTVEAIPDDYIQPSGTIEITKNGIHNVKDYENANVDLPIPDLSETTATESDVREGKEFFNASGEKVAGTYVNPLQWKCDNMKSLYGECMTFQYDEPIASKCKNVDDVFRGVDTSKVVNWNFAFQYGGNGCDGPSSLPPNLDTSSAISMRYTFSGIPITVLPAMDTRNVQNMEKIISGCQKLITVESLDMLSVTNASYMFAKNYDLTNLTLKNIKISLQIGSGTTWGHLLTLDSLLNTIKELWTNTGTSTKTLTVGSANLAKLADVYVKLIPITDEMRAEDEYIDKKAPFVQCESTDEGAMLVTEYATTVKNWQLA